MIDEACVDPVSDKTAIARTPDFIRELGKWILFLYRNADER